MIQAGLGDDKETKMERDRAGPCGLCLRNLDSTPRGSRETLEL